MPLLPASFRVSRSLVVAAAAAVLATFSPGSPAGGIRIKTEGARLQQRDFAVAPGRCGVKRLSLVSYDLSSSDGLATPFKTRNTMMAAMFDVSDPSCAGDYGFVQFIRGCVYATQYDRQTLQVKDVYLPVNRDWKGKSIAFAHPEWVVDTTGLDPIYTHVDFDPNASRTEYSYAFPKPISLKPDRRSLTAVQDRLFSHDTYFRDLVGQAVQLRIIDMPDGALFSDAGVADHFSGQSAALEFKTCLYHLADIPSAGDPAGFDRPESQGGPIACLDWVEKDVFNPATLDFDHSEEPGLSPVCARFSGVER